MPIKVYVCQKCETKFEYFHVNKEDKAVCPTCAATDEMLEQDMESFKNDFVLKGGPWAKDRYGH